jgi:hypothetical protein
MIAALLVALLAVIIFSVLRLGVGVDLRAMEQNRSDSSTGKLEASSIAQSFVCPRANLSGVNILLDAFTNPPEDGRVRLLRGDGLGGQSVYEAPLSTVSWTRNPFITVSFPPIANSEGQVYTIAIESRGPPLSSALGSVVYNSFDTLSSGTMYLDGESQPGDMAMELIYHYDMVALLGDVVHVFRADGLLALSWFALLLLPGLALLLWLPNGLTMGQRVIAAPGLSVLAFPVLLLITRSLNIKLATISMWLLIVICLAAIAYWLVRNQSKVQSPPAPGDSQAKSKIQNPKSKIEDVAFWAALAGILFVTLASRLLSLRDALAGMGLDAYHHTLIARMFVRDGGIPADYLPYSPLASFTYHYGFHAMTAAIGWLSNRVTSYDMMALMPQAGQIATTLPVLTLTLFGWRMLGDRWAGLAAGALAGLVCIFPAFYVSWSRYTQGLGLALLPLAWVLLIEALHWPAQPVPPPNQRVTAAIAARQSGPLMLAVIGAAGLALTHYRIAMLYAGFAVLYLAWMVFAALRARKRPAEAFRPLWRALMVAGLTLAAWSPWLVNLSRNFVARFVGKNTDEATGYYSLQTMVGDPLLNHPSLPIMYALSLGGLVWAYRRRDPLPLLPALAWLILGLWSNPYLFDPVTKALGLQAIRLPYAGYLDTTTLVTGVWLPLALLAGFTLSRFGVWLLSLPRDYEGMRGRVVRLAMPAAMGLALLLGGAASGLGLSPMIDSKPYIGSADVAAMEWMNQNLPRDAYVLCNPFAFPWDAPPYAIQGSDAGLWIPLLAGPQASVPPIPAYNERLLDPDYLDKIREVVSMRPDKDKPADWEGLQSVEPPVLDANNPPKPGVTHIYIGSRGGAFYVPDLLNDHDHVNLIFHQDSVWLFELK